MISPVILQSAFSLVSQSPQKFAASSVQLPEGNFAVLKLLSVTKSNFAKATQQEKENLTKNLSNFFGQMDYRFYVQSVAAQAKVKVYLRQLKAAE